MKNHEISRRDVTRMALAGVAAAALSPRGAPNVRAAEATGTQVKIAGYANDRVRAIQDGRLGLDRCDVAFHVEDIYHLNENVYGPARKYEVSETGLIPFITKYANNDFRAYGVKPNLKELDLVMRYTHEQGLAKRRLEVEELSHPSTLDLVET